MVAAKFEVVPFDSGDGYFVHGGHLSDMYVRDKKDADQICDALNQVERWKMRKTLRKIEAALCELESLKGELQ